VIIAVGAVTEARAAQCSPPLVRAGKVMVSCSQGAISRMARWTMATIENRFNVF